jgi:thiamine biosynthesis lipoprotein
MKLTRLSVIAVFGALALCPACHRSQRKPLRVQWTTMGTVAAVQCADHSVAADARAIADAAFEEVNRDFSFWRDDSLLSSINRAAGTGQFIKVTEPVVTVLETALKACEESGGAFNPLIGPAIRLWGFNGAPQKPHPPTDKDLGAAMALLDRSAVSIVTDSTGARVRLDKPGMSLDLGGIAKGYAVDMAWDKLKKNGHTNTMVDLGGNLRTIGEATPGRGGWRTGIRNPFETGGLLGVFLLKDGEAAATSGHYERFVVINGVRYTHIIDGRSGRPVAGMAGVTVIAPDAMTADALSTALFILGPRDGLKMLARYTGCEALWVPDTPEKPTVLATPGFASRLEILRPDAWLVNTVRE